MLIRTSKQIILAEQAMATSATPIDSFGTVVEKTIAEHPTDYDAFVVWHSSLLAFDQSNMFYDSGRMLKEDETRVRSLMLKYFDEAGDEYFNRTPEQIEQFLRAYTKNPMLTLVSVLQLPDLSGNPMWTFNIKK